MQNSKGSKTASRDKVEQDGSKSEDESQEFDMSPVNHENRRNHPESVKFLLDLPPTNTIIPASETKPIIRETLNMEQLYI